MVYFDKKTLSILKFIKHSGKNGVTWQAILNGCKGKEVSIQLLENLTREKWVIPTVISIISLVISTVSFWINLLT